MKIQTAPKVCEHCKRSTKRFIDVDHKMVGNALYFKLVCIRCAKNVYGKG